MGGSTRPNVRSSLCTSCRFLRAASRSTNARTAVSVCVPASMRSRRSARLSCGGSPVRHSTPTVRTACAPPTSCRMPCHSAVHSAYTSRPCTSPSAALKQPSRRTPFTLSTTARMAVRARHSFSATCSASSSIVAATSASVMPLASPEQTLANLLVVLPAKNVLSSRSAARCCASAVQTCSSAASGAARLPTLATPAFRRLRSAAAASTTTVAAAGTPSAPLPPHWPTSRSAAPPVASVKTSARLRVVCVACGRASADSAANTASVGVSATPHRQLTSRGRPDSSTQARSRRSPSARALERHTVRLQELTIRTWSQATRASSHPRAVAARWKNAATKPAQRWLPGVWKARCTYRWLGRSMPRPDATFCALPQYTSYPMKYRYCSF
eukprot:Rhum_TRINITY_DN17126_c0_g1::Rhum_TRINITY_DN17126_c0_g1_i1::g.165336::m.165336